MAFGGVETASMKPSDAESAMATDTGTGFMPAEMAAVMARGKEKSLLHITKAEIDLPDGTDVHSEEVYQKALENFISWQKKGWLRMRWELANRKT